MSGDLLSSASIFAEHGFVRTLEVLREEIRALYLIDQVPWVVGYSGGKDSTAVLQLVWLALSDLEPAQRHKAIHVISTDTLVENPVIAAWVATSLEAMAERAAEQGMPIHPHRLTPAVHDTFWVNLIGRGYPAPRHKFRWCTERLKINPSNAFIRNVVQESGEAILVLGTRKAESVSRARVMERLEQKRVRERLSPNDSLPNSLVYSPIEDWSSEDVWKFLMQEENPWGYSNKDLMGIYRGASPDAECPLVVDTSTPSCGDSRFGCWVCTLVEKDRSMQAMIQNDEDKEWMLPLLRLRDELDTPDDRGMRDFRRMNGLVQLFYDRPIPGPYTQAARANWLRKLLGAQQWVRENGPPHVRGIELVTLAELHEIRRIWVVEKHEVEDLLPQIYEEVVPTPFPGGPIDDSAVFDRDTMRLLRETCGDDLHFELVRELLDVEHRYQTSSRRAGLYGALEQAFRRGYYTDEADATDMARRRRESLAQANAAPEDQLTMDIPAPGQA